MLTQPDVLIEASVSRRTLPVNLRQVDLQLFEHELQKTIPATTLLHLNDVTVYPSGIITYQGRMLAASFASSANLNAKVRLKSVFERWKSKDHGVLDGKAIWCTDDWSLGYFHWLTDALPRLYLVREILKDATLLLPREYQKLEYVIASLIPFGIKDIKYVTGRMRCRNLLMPSHTAPTGNYNEEVIKGLRDLYTNFYSSTIQNTVSDRIYISRSRTSRRRIVNEKECLSVLEKHGFNPVYFEELSFAQQVAVSANARFMISNHGAGLTNMLFMSPGCNVYEFRKSGDALNNCYFTLASALGLRYHYQLCQSETHEEIGNFVDIIVDCEQLETNIQAMVAA